MMTQLSATTLNTNALPIGHSWDALISELDESVNFTHKATAVGMLEARYVERASDKFAVYISSQSGCNQGCRMCHLTATKQTQLQQASGRDIISQSDAVFKWYDRYGYKTSGKTAKKVHFAFMARGEPLDNPHILNEGDGILGELAAHAVSRNLFPKYLISTIFPKRAGELHLQQIFPTHLPEFYYSIYSMNDSFRRRWLPKARPAKEGLEILKEWQEISQKVPKLHYCFIEGENDSEKDIQDICDAVNELGLRVNINLIRYNPYSDRYGRDTTDEIFLRNAHRYRQNLPNAKVHIVVPVGFDVKVSCGMFCEKPH